MKRDKYDKVFSDYIRERDSWECRRCHTKYDPPTTSLQCSHYWGRGCHSVRWDEENAFAHCAGCHMYFEGRPYEFTEWVRDQLGDKRFAYLARRANTLKKWTKKEKEVLYKRYKTKIEDLKQGIR